MKKVFLLTLIFALLIPLASCSGGGDSPATPTAGENTTAETETYADAPLETYVETETETLIEPATEAPTATTTTAVPSATSTTKPAVSSATTGNAIGTTTTTKLAAPATTTTATTKPVTPDFGPKRNDIVALTNKERTKAGFSVLTADNALMAAAQIRAEECARLNELKVNAQGQHLRPDGSRWTTVLTGNYMSWAENIGQGYAMPQSMMGMWMGSKPHRDSILKPGFTMIGTGYAQAADGTHYWVQIFASY